MKLQCVLPVALAALPPLFAASTAGYAQLYYYDQEKRHLSPADPYANEELSEVDRGRITMVNFAGCLIKYNRRAASSFLKVFPGASDFRDRAVKVANPICLNGGALKFHEQLLRGSLFMQFYAEKFGQQIPPLRPTPIDYALDAAGQDPAKVQPYVASRQFVECVVRAAPQASRDVVLARIGTIQDDKAFKAIAPYLGPCLSAGAEVKLSRPALSGLIAEVLYRLSADTTPVSAGKS